MQSELPIIQQHQTQEAIKTKQDQAGIDAAGYVADPQWNKPDGISKDWNGMIQHAATNAPLSVPKLMATRDSYLAQTPAGVNPQSGAIQNAPLQEVLAHAQGGGSAQPTAANNNQPAAQGGDGSKNQPTENPAASQVANTNSYPHAMPTSMPAGFAENQKANQEHYQDVMTSADSSRNANAALNNVLDLSKNNAPTGQVTGAFYSWLAAHDLATPGAQTAAEQLQAIHAHASQIALAGGARSDSDLLAKQIATVGEQDLPKVIQQMAPYLMAVNDSKVAQANYYRSQDSTGRDADKISDARENWRNAADPRIFEMKQLQSNPSEFNKFMKGLDPSDAQGLVEKYKEAKKLGILGKK